MYEVILDDYKYKTRLLLLRTHSYKECLDYIVELETYLKDILGYTYKDFKITKLGG